MEYESLPLLGSPFEHVETYVYFDGRQTFAMRSTVLPDLYFIVNTVDDSDEDDTVTALAVAVNADRFTSIRAGVVPFRSAFVDAGPFSMFKIVWTYGGFEQPAVGIEQIRGRDLPAEWLPAEGARLNRSTQTVEPFVHNELVSLADAQARTIFAVEVETPGARITGFPGRNAGELQKALDGEVVALAREISGSSRSRAYQEIRSSVIGLRAASFVVVMGVDSVGSLLEATDVTSQIFTRLNELITAVGEDDETFLEVLKTHSSPVRNRFLEVLESVATVDSGIALTSVVAHSNRVVRAAATSDRVRSAVDAIRNVEPEVSHVDLPRGILTGLVLRRKRFEIVDASNPNSPPYKGSMTPEATDQANGLRVGDDSYVTGRIRVETPFAAADDETTGTKYILESIGLFDLAARTLWVEDELPD